MRLISILLLLLAAPCLAEDVMSILQTADSHYVHREDPEELAIAIDMYNLALDTDPQSFEAAWKLSKALWYQGNFASPKDKKPYFEKGIQAAKTAIQIDPNQCEGHFWVGINTALIAEASNPFKALGMVDDAKSELEKAMEINNNCVCGGPQRALGKMYTRLPFFKGGSKSKAMTLLKESLKVCPNDTQSRIFLAEIYVDDGRKTAAKQVLEQVIKLEPDPEWIPETKQNKIVAEKMLRDLKLSK